MHCFLSVDFETWGTLGYGSVDWRSNRVWNSPGQVRSLAFALYRRSTKEVHRFMLQKKCTTPICVRRNSPCAGKRALVASVFLLLLAVSRLVGSQSSSSGAPATPHAASAAAPARANTLPLDGLKLTDEQKTRIAEIRQNVEARRVAVIKNQGLSPDRKETILHKLQHIETSETFRVLTSDQQKEVQKRIMDQGAAAQKEPQSKQAAPASPTTGAP